MQSAVQSAVQYSLPHDALCETDGVMSCASLRYMQLPPVYAQAAASIFTSFVALLVALIAISVSATIQRRRWREEDDNGREKSATTELAAGRPKRQQRRSLDSSGGMVLRREAASVRRFGIGNTKVHFELKAVDLQGQRLCFQRDEFFANTRWTVTAPQPIY